MLEYGGVGLQSRSAIKRIAVVVVSTPWDRQHDGGHTLAYLTAKGRDMAARYAYESVTVVNHRYEDYTRGLVGSPEVQALLASIAGRSYDCVILCTALAGRQYPSTLTDIAKQCRKYGVEFHKSRLRKANSVRMGPCRVLQTG